MRWVICTRAAVAFIFVLGVLSGTMWMALVNVLSATRLVPVAILAVLLVLHAMLGICCWALSALIYRVVLLLTTSMMSTTGVWLATILAKHASWQQPTVVLA